MGAKTAALEKRITKAEQELRACRVAISALTTTRDSEDRELALQFMSAAREIWANDGTANDQIEALDELIRFIEGLSELAGEHGL